MAQEIPIYRDQLIAAPVDVGYASANINSQLKSISDAAVKYNENILDSNLRNSYYEYKALARKQISNAYEMHQNDPQKLESALSENYKAISVGVPIAAKGYFEEYYASSADGYISKAKSNQVTKLNQELAADTVNTLDNLTKHLDFISGDLLNTNDDIKAQASNAALTYTSDIIEALNTTGVDGKPIYDPVKREKFLLDLRNNLIKNSISNRFEQLQTLEEKEQFYNDLKNNNLSIPFSDNKGNKQSFNPLFELSRGEYIQLRNSMEKNIDQSRKLDQEAKIFEQIYQVNNGVSTPRPDDPDYVKGVNSVFMNQIKPETMNMDPKSAALTWLSYAKNQSTVPDNMKKSITAWIDSEDDNQLLAAANYCYNADEYFKPAVDGIDQNKLSKAMYLGTLIGSGMDKQQAVNLTRNLYDKSTAPFYQDRQKEFNRITRDKKIDFGDKAARTLDREGFFKADYVYGSLDNPKAAKQYRTLAEANFIYTNDLDKSFEMADKQFRLNWGRSVVNKGEITQHPPEKYYSVEGLSDDYMKQMGEIDLENIKSVTGLDIDPKTFRIYSDHITSSEVNSGRKPTYAATARDSAGNVVFINEIPGYKNFRWKPDDTFARQQKFDYLNQLVTEDMLKDQSGISLKNSLLLNTMKDYRESSKGKVALMFANLTYSDASAGLGTTAKFVKKKLQPTIERGRKLAQESGIESDLGKQPIANIGRGLVEAAKKTGSGISKGAVGTYDYFTQGSRPRLKNVVETYKERNK